MRIPIPEIQRQVAPSGGPRPALISPSGQGGPILARTDLAMVAAGTTLTSATGAQWVTAMTAMAQGLISDNAFGQVTVFLNYSDWFYATSTEYAAGYPKKIIAVLQEIATIREIVPSSKVPTGNIIGVAGLDSGEWGSILSAMPMVTRPKQRHNPEDDYVFGVMAAVAPQFRSDAADRSMIAHWTTA
jgi:hypothetical protein